MKDFIAIDFETANPKRVSVCALGYARVSNGAVVDSEGCLIKPVGGHASFQSKIHGIKEEHTRDQPDFGEIFPLIRKIFEFPLVGHSLFDKQVLKALSDHFGLDLRFEYVDSAALAKERLPEVKNCKLKTLAKHFSLPAFAHHDAREDAIACANVFLKLNEFCPQDSGWERSDDVAEFVGLLKGILADDEVNYKEALALVYWLEDHPRYADQYRPLLHEIGRFLEDGELDKLEAVQTKEHLQLVLSQV
jgi:DNA polymerase-3 subunit epsilon